MPQEYALAFFDILGFQSKFETLGLSAMEQKYRSLTRVVVESNEHMASLFGTMNFKESVYWTSEKDVVPVVRVFGAYASDSILVWSNAAWPDAREKTESERIALAEDPAEGWVFQIVPCDSFLRACNELICAGLELGLPFRGALAMGQAVLDDDERIFIGSPLIEAARLEKGQNFIGASCCPSFMLQTIPKRFLLPFDQHLKKDYKSQYGGAVLDWPRHWRATRSNDLREVVRELRADSGAATRYYDLTLAMIDVSDQYQSEFESPSDISIRSVYKAYASPELQASVKAVRNA